MARLVPKLEPLEIENLSERKVATVLVKQLPDSNVVIHSFEWTARRKQCAHVEGECDFIVLDPKYGMLFVEVKGGLIKYLPDEEIWVRILSAGRKNMRIKDPFKQVRRNRYEIVNYVKKKLKGDNFYFTHQHAVMFPDGEFRGQHPASVQREQILDENSLDQMQEAVRGLFRKSNTVMSERQFRRLQHALLPKFEIIPILFQTIENQEAMLHRATEDQKKLIDSLREHKNAAIRGGAGTGKTLLAIAKAQELAAAGNRTLLVCFNRALGDWLRNIVSDEFDDLLSIHTFHSLASEFCKLAKIKFVDSNSASDQNFWNEVAPKLLVKACKRLPSNQKFDAVIVDEGQDFSSLWWNSIKYVFRNYDQRSCYYVFYDPRQKFDYKNPVELPNDIGAPFVLDTNCRNTKEIAKHCADIFNEKIKTKADTPSGISPQIHREDSWQSAFRKANQIVKGLCRTGKHGLSYSQVVILTPGNARDHWPSRFRKIKIDSAINQWRKNKFVLVASLHQFKGLEADVVILLTPKLPKTMGFHHIEYYVGCSRAKHMLHVIYVDGNQSHSR